MCGRFSLTASIEELEKRFSAAAPPLVPRYTIAPTQESAVILNENSGKIVMCRWGLVPSWSKDGKGFINARAETIQEKPAFKHSFEKQRCLVLADGFFEWKKEGSVKTPYRVTLKQGRVFAFAGLWTKWNNALTFTIITVEPNSLVKTIHDRMPAILKRNEESKWLDGELPLLTAYPSSEMEVYQVSDTVNNPANDSAEVIERVKKEKTLFDY